MNENEKHHFWEGLFVLLDKCDFRIPFPGPHRPPPYHVGRAQSCFADVCGNKTDVLASVRWLMTGPVTANERGEVVIKVGLQQSKI